MKNLTKQFLLFSILLFLKGNLLAQCPTTGVPANVAKGKFDFTFRGTTTTVDGTNANLKLYVCGGSSFTFVDKSGLVATGTRVVYFFGIITNNTVPAITAFTQRSPITVGNTAGNYVFIQAIVDNTNTIKAYLCQPIEVRVPVLPAFTVSTCKAQEVTLSIPTHTNNVYDSYAINWGDGKPVETILKSQIPFTKNYSYTNTTGKIITITGTKTGDLCTGVNTFVIQPTGTSTFTPTIFSLQIMDDVSNDMRFIGANYTFDFNEKQADGTYKKVASVTSPAAGLVTQKIPAKSALTNQYCYKISVTDACGKTRESADEVCSLPLDVKAESKKNILKWKESTNPKFTAYRVSGVVPIQTITNAKTTTYTAENTRCIDYVYQVTAALGSVTSISNSFTIRGVDTTKPAPITNVYTNVEKGKVSIQVNGLPTGQTLKNYNFYHIENDKLESFYVGNGTRSIHDKSSPDTKRECYRIAYENSCNISSNPSELFCPVFLQQQANGLVWTDYLKYALGLNSYYLEKLDEKGTLIGTGLKVDKNLSFEPDPSTFDPNAPVIKFRIRAEATNRQNSYSNEIEYSQKMLMFIPDAFTPNGDEINKIFEVKGIAIKEFKMRITDRAGRALFETENYKEGWDGTYNGDFVQSGTYLYEIRATDFKGDITQKAGRVMLIR